MQTHGLLDSARRSRQTWIPHMHANKRDMPCTRSSSGGRRGGDDHLTGCKAASRLTSLAHGCSQNDFAVGRPHSHSGVVVAECSRRPHGVAALAACKPSDSPRQPAKMSSVLSAMRSLTGAHIPAACYISRCCRMSSKVVVCWNGVLHKDMFVLEQA